MKHTGLTLIEILFAALIISVLTAIVIFSASEARTTAQASNIINDFENLRMAYSVLYEEAGNTINTSDIQTLRAKFSINSLLKYINDVPNTNKYSLIIDDSGSWFITHKIENTKDASRLKQKLEGRKKYSGLLGSNDGKDISSLTEYSNQDYVIVKVR